MAGSSWQSTKLWVYNQSETSNRAGLYEVKEGTVARGITEVAVERLFGRYDYRICPLGGDHVEKPSISILYADNGMGKTTILELIFHLLSSADLRGHRTYIARVPFRRFTISFSDRSRITAFRPSDNLVGDFEIELILCTGEAVSAKVEVEPETERVTERSISLDAESLLRRISELDLDVFYLGDTRDLEGDTLPRRDGRRFHLPRKSPHFREDDQVAVQRNEIEPLESILANSIRRTEHWLNIEAMRASSTGETDARQSNAGILRTIASASAPTGSALEEEVAQLQRELKELEGVSGAFAEFELGAIIEADSLSESLASANVMTRPVVVQVLRSFLDGQRARLNAIRAIYEKMHRFVSITNEYLTDKTVTLALYRGMTIQLPGKELDPDLLSSGEKHLLLLFLNVFVSSDRSPLFIIDEPELSLNIKWQRRLVDSLLELSANSHCQFLMATHSIELLAKHSQHVVRLGAHG